MDTTRFGPGSGGLASRPLTSYPTWRASNAGQPLSSAPTVNQGPSRRPYGTYNAPAPRWVGGSAAPSPAASNPGPTHYAGVRAGSGGLPSASLPTHTGGVRVHQQPWRSWDRSGRTYWAPNWGYAPYGPSPVQVNVTSGFGYGPPPEPCPCVEPQPWPQPDPCYVEPAPVGLDPRAWPPACEPAWGDAPPTPLWPEPAPVPVPEPAPEPTPVVAPQVQDQTPTETQAARADAFGRAFEAFRRGAYEEALAGFDALTTSDAKDGEAWMAVAHSAFALGRYELSAAALAQAAALGGFPRGYRFDPAPLYAREGTFDGLLRRALEFVAAHPGDADVRLVLAWLDTSLGRRVDAQEQIQQVLLLRPADATAPVLAIALLPALPPAETTSRQAAPAR